MVSVVARVVLYSRPGCHLCEQALEALEALRRASSPGPAAGPAAFDLREVDIEADPELERRYLLEIPVIEVDGVEVTRAPVDIDAVRAALAAASGG